MCVYSSMQDNKSVFGSLIFISWQVSCGRPEKSGMVFCLDLFVKDELPAAGCSARIMVGRG